MNLKDLLQSHYGLQVASITSLEGYDSINYKVTSSAGSFVLKQHAYTLEIFTQLEAEHSLLSALEKLPEYDFPKPVSTLDKETLVRTKDQIFRLLTFVDGEFLGEVPHTPELLYSFGVFLAKMDSTIASCHEVAILGKETQWDLKHVKCNLTYLDYITDPSEKSLVDYFLLQFDEHVYPVQQQLRKSYIHNDGNDWNVLSKNGKISGIIDFGDMCHSWLINEVAIAMTYAMMGKENPLEVGAHLIRGYHEITALKAHEIDLLYYLVACRLATSVCNSAYAKTQKPDSEYITISEKPAWDLLRKWLTINPIKAQDTFRKAADLPLIFKKTTEKQLQRRNSCISTALSLSYDTPIHMYKSAFQYMYDAEGNTFLDAYNNIMLAGHCHPKVVRAGQASMAKMNTNTRYLYEELLAYSEKLLTKFPSKLNKVFFVNSGSAASDLAIRIATAYTKKSKIMVLEHGYHGNTRMGIAISAYKYKQQGGPGKQDDIIETPMPNAYASPFHTHQETADYFAHQTGAQIEANSTKIAAFIAEPIVGCGGQVPLAPGYLKNVYAKIREQGGICISDEVQVGFGRLGDYFWGYEMHEVIPDMVILGKPMANGHPIGAVVTTTEIAEAFDNGLEFFSSFGGNPVSCAIGHAVLDVIEEERLQQHAKVVGDYLNTELLQLQDQYREISDVRGSGLFLGVELVDASGNPNTSLAKRIKNKLRENYILIGTDGPFDSVLKIKPPLSFHISDAIILIAAIQEVLNDFSEQEK